MPPCAFCDRRADVVYRADSGHPEPRCWTHAPSLPEAIALGLIDGAADIGEAS